MKKRAGLFPTFLFSLFLTALAPVSAQNVTITKSIQPSVVCYGQTVTICLSVTASSTPKADIAWILDVTGSMGGSISNIISNITAFTSQLSTSGIDYQNGIIAYRDVSNPDSAGINDCAFTPIQSFPFTSNDSTFTGELNTLSAGGGGDLPESTLEGMNAAVNATNYCGAAISPLAWRPDASHTMIIVSDAPAHSTDYLESGTYYGALSMLNFPVLLHSAGFTLDVIGYDYSPTCGNCSTTYIASEGGGIFLPISSPSSSWNSFMSTLGTSVGQLTNVVLQDPLPPELAPVAGGASGESIVGNQVYFNIPVINLTGTPTPVEVCFPATVTSGSAQFINNTASFSSNGITAISSNAVSIWDTGPTWTFTNTPTITPTPTITDTPTLTPTGTPTPTTTNTGTSTPTFTTTNTATATPTWTGTPTSTATVTPTNTPSSTCTCVPNAWPDPFNPKYAVGGVMKFGCLTPGSTLEIYTISGEKVWSSNQASYVFGSPYTATWNGMNNKGTPAAPGIYFYVIRAGNQVSAKGKFLIMKSQ